MSDRFRGDRNGCHVAVDTLCEGHQLVVHPRERVGGFGFRRLQQQTQPPDQVIGVDLPILIPLSLMLIARRHVIRGLTFGVIRDK